MERVGYLANQRHGRLRVLLPFIDGEQFVGKETHRQTAELEIR